MIFMLQNLRIFCTNLVLGNFDRFLSKNIYQNSEVNFILFCEEINLEP